MMMTLLAFVVALGLLVAVHEYGHYRMARACGVTVLRFSVGFGKTIASWTPKNSSTEFALGLFPLGGYVKMLDEREAPVPPEQRRYAFNTQTLAARAAIVAAGPLANLMLAVLLYSLVNWIGVEQPQAVLASPVAGSVAQKAGLIGGEQVHTVAFEGSEPVDILSFEELRWQLARGALEGKDVTLDYSAPGKASRLRVVLPLADFGALEADAQLFQKIGLLGPMTRPVIGEVMPDGAASKAGLKERDLVLSIGGVSVVDGQQLRDIIRRAIGAKNADKSDWKIERNGGILSLDVRPEPKQDGDQVVGKIGAFVGSPPAMLMVRRGVWSGFEKALVQTWEVSALTLKMIGKMLIGQASLKNLSGPITIADYAGKSASLGLTQYLIFLALISVSLGVLNLLPLPVLDGGHLVYYLWEAVTGKGVSEAWMERLQRAGVGLLFAMMSIAVFNDLTRVFG